MTPLQLMQYLALLSCALFAGAAIYISLVEHPARMECGTELAATVFGPSYRRAALLQASLAAGCFVFAAAAWWLGRGAAWLIGGVLMLANIPFTLLVILPTNKRLLDPALDRRSAEAQQLLGRWARLHVVRSLTSLLALFVLGAALAFV